MTATTLARELERPSRSPTTEGLDRFGVSWAHRRVTVVGLGRSGIAAATLLHRLGASVRLTEATDTAAVREGAQRLRTLGVDAIEIGGHTRPVVEWADVVVMSPGVPESSDPVRWALEEHRPILSELELAFRFCRAPLIAVTGTNGKSSVVTLLTHVLHASGRRAVACGNIGIPFSSVVDQLDEQAVAVVEVSSFQLLWCERFRPEIGVLLNIGTNHLDRHADYTAYLAAKLRLFAHQTGKDWAVLNGSDAAIVDGSGTFTAQRVWFGDNRSNPPAFRLHEPTRRALPPSLQAVLQVARLVGVADPLSWQVMRAFRGLEHRLEYVTSLRGVHIVNDSKSTTPDSLLFALSRTPGDVVPIIGGRDKGMAFEAVVPPLHEARVKGVVLIGESRQRLRPLLNGSTVVRECETLEAAVQAALAMAQPGTTVLFSPACASFDMFPNFEARGQAFKRVISRLAGGFERCS